MGWLYLLFAILFEVSGTVCMKLSEGFSKLIPSILIFVFYIPCFGFMTLALKKLDVSIVYSIWAGLGTVVIVIVGMAWFKEPVTVVKLVSIFLIIAGVIGLRISGTSL